MNSEHSEDSPKITDEPMPEVSLTSKRVREPEETGKEITEIKKKKQETDIEFESCREHLRVIIDELESSNFENIREVLGMEPTIHVVDAIGTMIAMAGSTRGVDAMPSNCRKFYKERRNVIKNNVCPKDLHEEMKKENFYPKFLSKVSLFRSSSEQQPP